MNRPEVKAKIKDNLITYWKEVAAATLIIPIIVILGIFTKFEVNVSSIDGVSISNTSTWVTYASAFATSVAAYVGFIGIRLARGEVQYENLSTKDNFTWLRQGSDILDVVVLNLIIGVFTLLWGLLFVIPGIYKAFAYSQAVYVFFDYKRKGTPIGYLQAITESRRIMTGNKVEYFVISLSFLGYIILGSILMSLSASFGSTFLLVPVGVAIFGVGIAIQWFTSVYQYFTMSEFYCHLTK